LLVLASIKCLPLLFGFLLIILEISGSATSNLEVFSTELQSFVLVGNIVL